MRESSTPVLSQEPLINKTGGGQHNYVNDERRTEREDLESGEWR